MMDVGKILEGGIVLGVLGYFWWQQKRVSERIDDLANKGSVQDVHGEVERLRIYCDGYLRKSTHDETCRLKLDPINAMLREIKDDVKYLVNNQRNGGRTDGNGH